MLNKHVELYAYAKELFAEWAAPDGQRAKSKEAVQVALHERSADGEPELEGPLDAGSEIESVRLQYAQLQQTKREDEGEERLEEWGGEEGRWLRDAKDRQGGTGTWSAHTRRGFRRGTGAARRKTTQTMAVTPDGGVRSVAQPTEWPGRLEYAVRRGAERCGAT
jgi:hypothetical protein